MRPHAKLGAGILKAAKAGSLPPGRIGDGGGLWVSIGPNGNAAWLFRFTRDGTAQHMGLGSLRDVTPSVAREQAAKARSLLAVGKNPVIEREREEEARRIAEQGARTFGDAVESFLDSRPPTRNGKHNDQWRSTLHSYALPSLGKKPIADLTRGDVLEVIEPIWRSKNETARRLRGRIERVIDAAMARGWRERENPARLGPLVAVLGRSRPVVEHHAAMSWQDVPAFVKRLRKETSISARALEFTILTAARSGEVIGATWPEIDKRMTTWAIDGARMKAGKDHRVPLTQPAQSILHELKGFREEDNPSIFIGGTSTGGLSNMALPMLLRRLDREDVTVHGFRTSFRTWAREAAKADHDVAELCLAHVTGSAVVQAYQRSDLFAERRELLKRWAAFVWR